MRSLTPRQALSEMFGLSPRQTDVLEYILAYIGKHGYPPSRAEIRRRLGLRSSLNWHMCSLRKKGAIDWQHGQYRTITPRVRVMR